jgi:hypothetical protein
MKTKYRTMRCVNENHKYLQIIRKKHFPTMTEASLGNEFLNRYIREHFPEIVQAVDTVVNEDDNI